jgi:hypothetical protein
MSSHKSYKRPDHHLLRLDRFLQHQNKTPARTSTATGTMTPIAIFAPVDSPLPLRQG